MPDPKPRVLIVEDERDTLALYTRAATSWGYEVLAAESAADGLKLLESGPQIVVLDIRLSDGSGVRVAERACGIRPAPAVVVATSHATREEVFELARLGVRRLLEKPFDLIDLQSALEAVQGDPPELTPHILQCVGSTRLPDLQQLLRQEMLDQALALTNGNRTAAARLLGVTRQAVQKAMRDPLDPEDPAS